MDGRPGRHRDRVAGGGAGQLIDCPITRTRNSGVAIDSRLPVNDAEFQPLTPIASNVVAVNALTDTTSPLNNVTTTYLYCTVVLQLRSWYFNVCFLDLNDFNSWTTLPFMQSEKNYSLEQRSILRHVPLQTRHQKASSKLCLQKTVCLRQIKLFKFDSW